jgi:hypothetical protein
MPIEVEPSVQCRRSGRSTDRTREDDWVGSTVHGLGCAGVGPHYSIAVATAERPPANPASFPQSAPRGLTVGDRGSHLESAVVVANGGQACPQSEIGSSAAAVLPLSFFPALHGNPRPDHQVDAQFIHTGLGGGPRQSETNSETVIPTPTACWHMWPDELLPESGCTICGLEYTDWST